jgi:uncharacterized protein (TIGR03435 family)
VRRFTLTLLFSALATVGLFSQAGPTFDVVSIKKNTSGALGSNGSGERPDGGFRLLNIPAGILLSRAYPPVVPLEMVGLPDWVMRERYDVIATSPLEAPTPDQRIAMLRAMLADRFKLAAHTESREQEVYEVVLARKDGRLGPNIKPSEVDCVAKRAADAAAGVPPWRPTAADMMKGGKISPPTCVTFTMNGHMEGDMTMASFAMWVAVNTGGRRRVVDKTGLSGSYRVKVDYDSSAAFRGPEISPQPDSAPSIFTALPDQLSLKLEAAKIIRETLVIDHLERPTEN